MLTRQSTSFFLFTICDNVCWKEIGFLVFVWFSFLGLQIAKVPISLGVSGYEAVGLYKGTRTISSKGDAVTNLGVGQLVFYFVLGFSSGMVGGLLGIGGGLIMGPLFLELGIPPQVASATATFAMMFSSSMSAVEYYLLKRFPVSYALYFLKHRCRYLLKPRTIQGSGNEASFQYGHFTAAKAIAACLSDMNSKLGLSPIHSLNYNNNTESSQKIHRVNPLSVVYNNPFLSMLVDYIAIMKMAPYEAFACCCGKGDVVLRESYQPKHPCSHVKPSPYTTNPVTLIPGPSGVVHVSNSNHVDPSTSNLNPVRIIPGPAGLVQQAKLLKEKVFILDPDGTLMSTQQYMDKVVEDVGDDDDFKSAAWVSATNYVNIFGGTVTGCLGDVNNFLNNGKLKLVIRIVKSCSPNMLGDLNVTMKDLSGTIPRTIHPKVIGEGGYGKDITVGAAMILTNVCFFSYPIKALP
nr:sulfite exporter TauE/SafE family protein 3-like [Tanacetum cinerariifolium]